MCGIVGYIGSSDAAPVVMHGLRQLEYRGYDSAGLAVIDGGGCIQVRREAGKLSNLEQLLADDPVQGAIGVGRTHVGPRMGRPAAAMPTRIAARTATWSWCRMGSSDFLELRHGLQAEGYVFQSDTDTEVIVHLIHRNYHNGCAGDLELAVRKALANLKGPS